MPTYKDRLALMLQFSSRASSRCGTCQSLRQRAAVFLLLLVLQALPALAQAPPPPPPTTTPPAPPPPPPAVPANATLASDVDGLTQFKAGIDNSALTVLNGWSPNTDPCYGNWPGVICSCGQLFQSIVTCNVSAVADPSGYARVLGLYIGPLYPTTGQRLSGTIAPALGQLTALMYLDLSRNSLRGPIPDSLASLTSLQWLVLSNNQLTGTLPAYLGSMPVLKGAQLQDNQLNGSLPTSTTPTSNAPWCSNNATYSVQNNPSLCGFVPTCTGSALRIPSTANTFLVPANASLSAAGGVCDTSPPVCSPDLSKIYAPAYWTTTGYIYFNFTAGCQDVDSGILRYQWGIGTGPGLADVLPLVDYNSTFQPPQQTMKLPSNGDTPTVVVYQLVSNMTTVTLRQDQPYYITVAAVNKAGPRLSSNFSMGPIGVDTTPPRAAAVYNTYDFKQASSTTNVRFLSASWDNFTDTQSGVVRYTVQFYQTSNGSFVNITAPVEALLSNRAQVQVVQLQDGFTYYAQVTAYNGAGLSTTQQGQPIVVNKELAGGMAATITAIIVVITSLACMMFGAAVTVLIMRGRVHQQRQRDKERQQESKQLKALMYALTSTKDDASKNKDADSLRQTKEFAFVVTDIEDSTLLSHQDPGAFQQMQEIHDQIMREGIAKHSGYEIITEGDSFSIAFTSVQPAVQFCLECQYRLLETCWPKRVLKLSSCKPVTGPGGELIFQGPRVRMGVHWAKEGTVVHRLHNLTRHRIFAGPGMQIAQDVGETAHGGQVLVTQDAWAKLRENMGAASFPVVHLLGLYQLPALPSPIWIYDISEMVGKPLPRSFPPPRKIAQVWPRHGMKMPASWGLHIMPPPRLSDRGSLTFVWARLTTFPQGVRSLPLSLQNKLEEVIAAQAQQFKGYMFSMDTYHGREGKFGLAFEQAMDAIRFAHAAQMQFMYTRWPPEAADFYGLSVPSPDGRWVFQGPRVAMALHESDDFQINAVEPDHPVSEEVVDFVGPATEFTLTLSRVARGGQVVLSESAWDAVKPVLNQHPGAAQVVSLGTHILNEEFPDPVLLMEVLPNLLARRNFKLPVTRRMLEPGYRDAPHPSEPMAIVFVKAAKPSEVARAERIGATGEGEDSMCDDDVFAAITAFQVGVSMYCSCARRLLRAYDGYECKEPEPGKFTLAFRRLDAAVRWACHMQQELLAMPWPEELLRMDECAPIYGSSGELIWAGLRVRVGMAYGYVSSKKPLNTGRADYFGVLANMAARVSALAAPGQVMLESSVPPTVEDGTVYPQLHDELPTNIPACWAGVPPPSNAPFHQQQLALQADQAAAFDKITSDGYALNPGQITPLQQGSELVELRPLGHFLLRGIDNPKLLFQATAPALAGRHFALPTDSMVTAPSGHSLKASFGGSYSLKRYQLSWLSWMNKTQGSWMSKRTAPSSSGNSLPMYKRRGMAAAAQVDSPGLSMAPDSAQVHARNRLIQSLRKSKGGSISAGPHSSGDNILDHSSGPADLRQLSGASTQSAPGDPRYGGVGGGSGLGSSLRLGSAPNMARQGDAMMSRLRLAPIQTALSPGDPHDTWGAESSINTAQTPTTPMLDSSPLHHHSAGGAAMHSRHGSWGGPIGSEVSFSSRSYSPMHAFMNTSFVSVPGAEDKGKLSALRRPFQYLRINTGKQRSQQPDVPGAISNGGGLGPGMQPGGPGAAESPMGPSPLASSTVPAANGQESQIPSRMASPAGYDLASPGAFAREVAYAYLHHKHNTASSQGSMSANSSPYPGPAAPTLESSPSPPPRQPSLPRAMSDGGHLARSASGPAASAAALRASADSAAALQLLNGGYGVNGTSGTGSSYIDECMAWRAASETAGSGRRGPRVQAQQLQQQVYYGGTQTVAGSGRLSSHPMAGNSGNGYWKPDEGLAGGSTGAGFSGAGAQQPGSRVRAQVHSAHLADDSEYGDDETEEEHSPGPSHMAADMDGRVGRSGSRMQQGSQPSPMHEYQHHRQQQLQGHSHHGSPIMSPRHLQQLPPQQLPTLLYHRRSKSTHEYPTASTMAAAAEQLPLNPNPLTAERSPAAGSSSAGSPTVASAAAAVLGSTRGSSNRRSRSASADDITFMYSPGSPNMHQQQQQQQLHRMATEAYPIDAGQVALAYQQQQQSMRAGLMPSPRANMGTPGVSPRGTNAPLSPRGGTYGLPELPSPMWRDTPGNRSTGRASPEPSLLGPMRGGSAVWATNANAVGLSPRSLDSARSGGGGNAQYSPAFSPPGSGAYPSPRDVPATSGPRQGSGFESGLSAAAPQLLRGDAALLGRESPSSPRADPLNATFPGSLRGPSASGLSAMMGGAGGAALGYPLRNGRQWIAQQFGGSRSPSSAGGRDSPRSLAGFGAADLRRGGSSNVGHGGTMGSSAQYSDDDDDDFQDGGAAPDGLGRGPSMISLDGHPNLGPMADIPEMRALEGRTSPPRGGRSGGNSNRE